jgi:caa(3)-type oxidase subunit IV
MSEPSHAAGAVTGHTVHHDAGPDHGHEEHIPDSTFIKVFGALLVFTAISFAANQVFGAKNPIVNFIIIGLVACCKAFLVMYFFMHLKIDWRKVFVFLIPICILAPMVIIVLWPDMVLAWRLASPDSAP